MPKFSTLSIEKIKTCHIDLQTIFNEVVKHFDCTILVGHRGEQAQNQAYAEKKSKLKFPESKHNTTPSMAVDSAPYPLPEWKNLNDFIYFGGYVGAIADMLFATGKVDHKVRYGGDWNKNDRVSDNSFMDAVHFELYVPEKK